mgnify:CR=1 FL=1
MALHLAAMMRPLPVDATDGRPSPTSCRRGLTLVELMVVIAILVVLMALLLPAVQGIRESARRLQCSTNLRQIGQAAQVYHRSMGRLPPMRSYIERDNTTPNKLGGSTLMIQNGFAEDHRSWLVWLLPQLEQSAMYDRMDLKKSGLDNTVNEDGVSTNRGFISQPLDIFVCPSDPDGRILTRSADEASSTADYVGGNTMYGWYLNNGIPLARTNYSANSGDHWSAGYGFTAASGPDCGQCSPGNGGPCSAFGLPEAQGGGMRGSFMRGVISRSGWSASSADIPDGLSNTFLAGECRGSKCLWQDWGFQNQASTTFPLNWEHWSLDTYNRSLSPAHCRTFRSCHSGGAYFVMTDGSVHFLTNEIEFDTYTALSTRRQGELASVPQ